MAQRKSWVKQTLLVLLACAITLLMFELGKFLAVRLYFAVNVSGDLMQSAFNYFIYIAFWSVWIVCLLINKYDRHILGTVWTKPAGNKLRFAFLGLALGMGINLSCAAAALLNGDIALTFDSIDIGALLLMFVCVFIQCSAEEILYRGYLYQKTMDITGKPIIAVLLNPLLFAAAHLLNPGVSALAVLNIVLAGIFMSLLVYYFDSLWCAFAFHTAWNFTQSCILGLPNSGVTVPFSVFKLDTANARNSIFYDAGFGVEGTVIACAMFIAAIVVLIMIGRRRNMSLLGKKPAAHKQG